MPTWTPAKGATDSNRRRSQRVILTMPVAVRAEGGPRLPSFEEDAQTLIVNAHGALIALAGKLKKGQALRLTNRTTHEELLCHVVHVGSISDGKAQVGVEFDAPSPDFWRIAFPPEDWQLPEHEPVAHKSK
jgi:hypothetical protein